VTLPWIKIDGEDTCCRHWQLNVGLLDEPFGGGVRRLRQTERRTCPTRRISIETALQLSTANPCVDFNFAWRTSAVICKLPQANSSNGLTPGVVMSRALGWIFPQLFGFYLSCYMGEEKLVGPDGWNKYSIPGPQSDHTWPYIWLDHFNIRLRYPCLFNTLLFCLGATRGLTYSTMFEEYFYIIRVKA
jgi:hypothetical protein